MIGELKQANDMDLVDPVREDQQVQRIRRLAEEAACRRPWPRPFCAK